MTLTADLFYSFRSPYSYLGTKRYRALAKERNLDLRLRPVYPIAIRTPEFFKQVNPLWPPYLKRDVQRVAAFMGIPFVWPDPDPVVMDMGTLSIAAEQPYIHRLTFLGVAAARRGRGLAFADEVMGAIWGGVKNWHLPENLGPAVARAGLDLAELEGEIEGSEGEFRAEIGENQAALQRAGHWGVPTLVFEGEPFFGQDRIDLAVWTMERRGLTRRA
jgi:2-hydroxychromene-2-carboxylate isomerase